MSPGRLSRFPSLTVQGWFRAVFMVLAILVIAAAVTITQLLSEEQGVSANLQDHLLPAQAQAYRLQAALLDQETGVRGFGITGRADFLKPYTDGLATERAAEKELHTLIGRDQQLSADLGGLVQAANAWRRSYAQPLIALARHGPLGGKDLGVLDASKSSFDHLRTLFGRQNAHLATAVAHDTASQGRARDENDLAFIIILAVFLIAAGALTVVLHRAVVAPLSRLRTASRHVVDGDFTHRIELTGPADVRAVAADVEGMRSELVTALEGARAAEEVAASQAADLDAQAAELMRSNAELEQFAYVASHDLQEPLRKVASFCQLLERRYRDQLDDRAQQYIDFAVDGAKRMQRLINDLLTLSRVGRGNAAHVQLALDEPLDAALAFLEPSIEETGAVVERPGPLPGVLGDATLLAMLWQNLIGNGIKFRAPDRAPVVRITFTELADESSGAMWEFSVEDNGIGIAAEFTEKVFVIFQRLHGRDAYPGTGIGLALCKRIVEHHGGTIRVDTAYAGGTRICFTLPRIAAGQPDQPGQAPDTAQTSVATTEGIPA